MLKHLKIELQKTRWSTSKATILAWTDHVLTDIHLHNLTFITFNKNTMIFLVNDSECDSTLHHRKVFNKITAH